MDELWKVKAVSRTFSAIAALLSLSGGSLCPTGHNYGGDSSVALATEGAFAAADGSVVTWDSSDNGGDSSAAQYQLKHIEGASHACAAIPENVTVITWKKTGGDAPTVKHFSSAMWSTTPTKQCSSVVGALNKAYCATQARSKHTCSFKPVAWSKLLISSAANTGATAANSYIP